MGPKAEKEFTWPRASVVEERIASGSARVKAVPMPELTGQPVPMALRWFNVSLPNRFYVATEQLGWMPVEPHEIAGGMVGGLREVDGKVHLSDDDVLMKMPAHLYDDIQRTRAQQLEREMKSRSKMIARATDSLERDAKAQPERANEFERVSEAGKRVFVTEHHVEKRPPTVADTMRGQ